MIYRIMYCYSALYCNAISYCIVLAASQNPPQWGVAFRSSSTWGLVAKLDLASVQTTLNWWGIYQSKGQHENACYSRMIRML